jgi:pimeloyl-ACP methyl ester carboxylesterase
MCTDTFKASMAALADYDGRDTLRQLTVPVQLIAGETDPAYPAAGMELMDELIAESHLHVIAGAGHYTFAQRPEEYHTTLLAFLRGLPASVPSR